MREDDSQVMKGTRKRGETEVCGRIEGRTESMRNREIIIT